MAIYCTIITQIYSPLAQSVERVAVKFAKGEFDPELLQNNIIWSEGLKNGSFSEKSGLKQRANSGKPWVSWKGNPELSLRNKRSKCAETIHPPPKSKAQGDDIVRVRKQFRVTCNHQVRGSSPRGGAIFEGALSLGIRLFSLEGKKFRRFAAAPTQPQTEVLERGSGFLMLCLSIGSAWQSIFIWMESFE